MENHQVQRYFNTPLYRIPLFSLLNVFSVFVVLGSLCSGYLFIRLTGADLPAAWWWLLPSTVWLIYTADHLLDGYKVKERAMALRHYLHYRFRNVLVVVVILLVVLNAVLALVYLPSSMIITGIFLAVGVAIYMLVIHRLVKGTGRFFMKEMAVATVYTGGVAGCQLVAAGQPSPALILAVVIFGGIAQQNLLLFSWFDRMADQENQFISASRSIGERTLKRMLNLIFYVLMAGCAAGLYLSGSAEYRMAFVILALMSLFLAFIMLYSDWFSIHYRYRFWGDAIFLLPAVLFFL